MSLEGERSAFMVSLSLGGPTHFRLGRFLVASAVAYQVRCDVSGDENVSSVRRHVPPVST